MRCILLLLLLPAHFAGLAKLWVNIIFRPILLDIIFDIKDSIRYICDLIFSPSLLLLAFCTTMTTPAIPAFGKMYLVDILIESILYGLNCVIFGSCVYILTVRRKGTSRILLGSSVFLFSLSTAHLVIAYIMLLHAFTDEDIMRVPRGADIYFSKLNSPLVIADSLIFVVNVLGQDLLLIWRLYIVYKRNWKICMVPLLVETVNGICAFVSIGYLSSSIDLSQHDIRAWGISSWLLVLATNMVITCAIAFCLWRAGRQISTISVRRVNYAGPISKIVESGAIFVIATAVIFVLNVMGNPVGFVGFFGIAQVVTISPLLIIVRVGLGLTHGNGRTSDLAARGIEITVSREEVRDIALNSSEAYAMHSVASDGKNKASNI